jgi:hypothetical protein
MFGFNSNATRAFIRLKKCLQQQRIEDCAETNLLNSNILYFFELYRTK